jgi:hypothetical protein
MLLEKNFNCRQNFLGKRSPDRKTAKTGQKTAFFREIGLFRTSRARTPETPKKGEKKCPKLSLVASNRKKLA